MRARALTAVLVGALLASPAARADDPQGWKPGDAVPSGYRAVPHVRTELAIAGAFTFGMAYGSAFVVAAGTPSRSGSDGGGTGVTYTPLFAPIVGPFLMTSRGHGAAEEAVFLVDGLAQCTGVAMIAIAFAAPRASLEREPRAVVRPVPLVGNGTTGLGVVGAF